MEELYDYLYSFKTNGRRRLFQMIQQLWPTTRLATLPNEILDLIADYIDKDTRSEIIEWFTELEPTVARQDIVRMAESCGVNGTFEHVNWFFRRQKINILQEAIILDPLPLYFGPVVRLRSISPYTSTKFVDRQSWIDSLDFYDHTPAALHIVDAYPYLLQRCSDRLKDDIDVVRIAVEKCAAMLIHASTRLKDIDTIVQLAITKSGSMIQVASTRLQDDYDTVMMAVANKKDGDCGLPYASLRLRGNRSIVQAAVASDGLQLQYASSQLEGDREIALIAVRQNGISLRFATNWKDDHQVVLAAVSSAGIALRYASTRLQDDDELVRIATIQTRNVFYYLGDRFRGDFDFVHFALSLPQNGSSTVFQFVSNQLKDNVKIVKLAVASFALNLKYASPRLRNNYRLVKRVIEKSPWALQYASRRLQADSTIVALASNYEEELRSLEDDDSSSD